MAVLSLTGCSGPFTDTVTWRGGTFYAEGTGSPHVDNGRMSLTLRADGTGFVVDLPRGYRKTSDRPCTPVTGEKPYSGKISWHKVNNFLFEIKFPGSHYGVAARPEKFDGDWTEARIQACNGRGGYWSVKIDCGQPGLVAKEIPRCRD
ncbi:hypothetical protein SAMN04515692_101447 [Leifsonia sp. CL147]|nr:hypothetical protein SAMN04515694_10132 [Leifsonia sp. CL154]SFL23905.1 hypothetical protein SAMN04515692_101447 [Leifsonia sp. CL147]